MAPCELSGTAAQLRLDAIKMVYLSGDGHLGPSLSAADIITTLYFKIMKVDPKNPQWADRDRFILSKGHACPALYAALAMKGFFSKGEYPSLRKMDSLLQGHPDMKKTPGVDMTTGSLGNGLGAGFGMAMAGRLTGKDYRTYVLCGDGELGEGVLWEAAQAAPKYRLGTLTLFIDNNGMQSGGTVEAVGGVINIPEKFQAFGWNVLSIDGHDYGAILDAAEKARACEATPTCIIARTIKGKGVPFMEHNNAWHKRTPTPAEYADAVNALGGMLHD